MTRNSGILTCTLAIAIALPLAGCGGSSQPSTNPAASAATASPPPAAAPAQPQAAAPEVAAAPAGTAAADNAAGAGADAAVDQQIKDVAGGDPKAFHDVFDRLQKGLAAGDKAGVAALVSYPLQIHMKGKTLKLASAQDLVKHWDEVFTPEITKAIADQQFSGLFVNAQGAMLGDGQVWISAVCDDDACKSSKTLITAIQSGPEQ